MSSFFLLCSSCSTFRPKFAIFFVLKTSFSRIENLIQYAERSLSICGPVCFCSITQFTGDLSHQTLLAMAADTP